ncbi:extracellular solute-binding protein [Streptomyces sp. DSM 44915]|uniref:Extracellular solute-binding protein n=1 Tax=Streptomyces chisholmiae TaxID=3075540 RepID=A0ABU2JVT4_9ACTN|nr:extracellular solute-binding protein [Streptomyces sp. DSM 44915]MDT0269045.1 extracellular solute-binding protein [Streptomyces sp. DSM 44915]
MTGKHLRRTGVVTALAASLVSVTACGGGGGSNALDEDVSRLTVMVQLLGQAPAEDGYVWRHVEEFAGVELDIDFAPASNYRDRLTTTIASGDIPALLVTDAKEPTFTQAARAGAFWDLTERIRDYPNLLPAEADLRDSMVNGVLYGVPQWSQPIRGTVMFREDWLANLGLDVPETTDELHEVARAFTEDDPDGNGQDDTYGLIMASWSPLEAVTPYAQLESWFGAPNGWGEVDGELVPSFTTEEFFEANRFLRGMVEDGLVNPGFATFDGLRWNDVFVNGEGGIIIDVSNRPRDLMNAFEQRDPGHGGDYVTATGSLLGPDGERRALFNHTGSVVAISRSAVPTEEMLDRVLSVLDRLASPEGQLLTRNGVEGETFTEVDGYAQPVQETNEDRTIQSDLSAFTLWQSGAGEQHWLPTRAAGAPMRQLVATIEAAAEVDAEHAVRNPAYPYFSEVQAQRGAQLGLIVTDARMKYLSGVISEDEFRAEIDRWFDEGGQDIVDDINELHGQAN